MRAIIYVEECLIFHIYYFINIKKGRLPGQIQDKNSIAEIGNIQKSFLTL